MNQLQRVTRTQELAEEIRSLVKLTAEGVVEIGHRLIEARSILKAEGRWIAWLEEEFEWSVSTAYNFIRVAKAVKKESKLLKFRAPSVLYLVSGAPEEAFDALLDFEGGYAEAKLVIDAHKWAEKTHMTIDALRHVDMPEAYAQGNSRTVNLARLTAGRVLAELDAAMTNGEARPMAVEIYREHGQWLSDMNESDAIENMKNAGTTLRERQGEPATGKVTHKLYEYPDTSKLVVWCSGPHTIAEFPRTGSAQADAWRVTCIEACMKVVGE